jgi:site-specific recombinase XerD
MTTKPVAPDGSTAAARRTPPKRKARQLARHLRDERPDYAYLKAVFRALRDELGVDMQRQPKTLPYVPSEDEIRRYYTTVRQARRTGDMVLIKTLLYTGVRVAELSPSALTTSTWTPAGSASPAARAAKTASCRSRRPSAKRLPCI